MLRTIDVVQGLPLPDCSALDATAALARKGVVQRLLGASKGDDSKREEREQLKAENFALEKHLRYLREEDNRQRMRRTFAGMGSPLHDALLELHPELVAELELVAMRKLGERERRSAERKAQKKSNAGAEAADSAPQRRAV